MARLSRSERWLLYSLIVTLIVAILFVGGTILFIFQTLSTPCENEYKQSKFTVGSPLTEAELISEIDRILGNYCLVREDAYYIFNNGDNPGFTFQEYSDVTGKVLYFNTYDTGIADLDNYAEVQALMDIWMFVSEHELPFQLDGIAYWFHLGRANSTDIHISTEEFLQFYDSLQMDNLCRKEKVKKMTEVWLEKVKYVRSQGIVDVSGMTK